MTSKFFPIFFISTLLLLLPHTLFSAGSVEELPAEVQVITEMQDRYNSIKENIPAMMMLATSATSIIPTDFLLRIDTELPRLLVNRGKVKPVSMDSHLTKNFSKSKATNPFVLMNALNREAYAVSLKYICKPYIFKSDDYYVLSLTFYPLSAPSSYPVTVLRLFESYDDLPSVLNACLDEMEYRLFEKNRGAGQKRIVIQEFSLSFLQMVELETGEFQFIDVPFIEQYGVPLRNGDDYFSLIMGYVLSTTDMFKVMRLSDFSEFTDTRNITVSQADYSIEGKVQLSDQLNILYVDIRNLRDNTVQMSIRYPLTDYTLTNIWNAYRDISSYLINAIMDEDRFGYVPTLNAEGRAFYANDMFIGWDSLKGQIFQKGLNEIYTGSYYRQGSQSFRYEKELTSESKKSKNSSDEVVDVYYVLLDAIDQLLTDREGEFLWSLLKKGEK